MTTNGRSGKAPAFQWYAADWLADMHVRNMSLAARGAYADLLSLSWREGPLPDDVLLLAKAIAIPVVDLEAVWQEVRARFTLNRDRRLVNRRLEGERRELDRFKKDRREAGRRGGQATAARYLNQPSSAQASAQAQPKPASASASSSASAKSLPETTLLDGEQGSPGKGVAVVKRQGRTYEAVTAHLGEVLATERRDEFEHMKVEAKRQVMAELVFAYWQIKRRHKGALLDDERERLLVKTLKANRDNLNELLYVVDGASKDPWDNRAQHDGVEVLFRNRAQVERFASFCPGYKDGVAHPTAVRYGLAAEVAEQ